MRTWLISLGAVLGLLLAAAEASAVNEEGLAELTEKNECADITLAYPVFGIQEIDNGVSSWAESYFRETVEDYQQYCLEDPDFREKSAAWNLSVTARELKSTPGTVSIYFSLYGYSGAVPPNQGAETLVLDMEGKRLGFDDLFGNTEGLWDFLSERVKADMRRRAKQNGGLPGPDSLTVAPKPESFKHFLVTPKGLTLIFTDVQAADDSVGELRIDVSLNALAGFNPQPGLWADPTAAQPAFDCAKQANRVEAEICANPILARCDEVMAKEYELVQEVVDKEALKKEQDLWRERMQSQCDSDSASLCILEHYTLRLAKLRGIKAAL